MNPLLKVASAAALSAVAVSVAALSVPAIQVHALKLLDEISAIPDRVAHITTGKIRSGGLKPMNKADPVETPELKLELAPLPSDDDATGVLDASSGAVEGTRSNQGPAARSGSSAAGWGSASSSSGLPATGGPAGASQAWGRDGSMPSLAGTPYVAEETSAVGSVPSAPDTQPGPAGGVQSKPAPEGDAAPAQPLEALAEADREPANDSFEEMAALRLEPDSGFTKETDSVLSFARVALSDDAAAAVPEPGTLALLGVAIFGMGALRRRRGGA